MDFAVRFLLAGGLLLVLFAGVFDGEDDLDFDVLDLAGVEVFLLLGRGAFFGLLGEGGDFGVVLEGGVVGFGVLDLDVVVEDGDGVDFDDFVVYFVEELFGFSVGVVECFHEQILLGDILWYPERELRDMVFFQQFPEILFLLLIRYDTYHPFEVPD